MKYKIVLACALGMSTAIMVKKIRNAASDRGIEIECDAYSVNVVKTVAEDADCLLLGPQAAFLLDQIQAELPNVPVAVIPMQDYGTMNGEHVFHLALSLINQERGEK